MAQLESFDKMFYFLNNFLAEYKLPQLVTNIEFELPFQWETDQIPPLCVFG